MNLIGLKKGKRILKRDTSMHVRSILITSRDLQMLFAAVIHLAEGISLETLTN
jgi:hypothetical protein